MTKLYRTLLPGESQENSYDVSLSTVGAYHSPVEEGPDGNKNAVVGDAGTSVPGVWEQEDALWSVDSSGIYGRVPATPFPNGKNLCGFSINGNYNTGNFPATDDPIWPKWKGRSRRNEVNQVNASTMGTVNGKDTRWISYAFCLPGDDGWYGGSHDGSKVNYILQSHETSDHAYSPIYAIRIRSWTPGDQYSDGGKPLIVELTSEIVAGASGTPWPSPSLTGDSSSTPYQMPISQAIDKWSIWTMRIKFSRDNDGEFDLYVHDAEGVGGLVVSETGIPTYWSPFEGSYSMYWKNGGYQQPEFHFWTEMLIGDENETIDSMLDYMVEVTPPAYTILGDITGSATIASILPQINGDITGSAVIEATLNTVNPSPDLPAASDEVTYEFTVSGSAAITYTAEPEE